MLEGYEKTNLQKWGENRIFTPQKKAIFKNSGLIARTRVFLVVHPRGSWGVLLV